MKLILAEKPSVAKDIARVIGADKFQDGCLTGNGYIVSNFLGHLIEPAVPQDYDEKFAKWNLADLPIIPEQFKYRPIADKVEALNKMKKLIDRPDVESLICATDAGREGEVIFRYVYDFLNCKKPYKRLWISSLTDESIKNGMENLVPGKDNLFKAGAARAQVDWLVGMNFSRLYSIYFNDKFTVGRVQTATLNLIVRRDREIANFVKKPFYRLLLENGAEWFNDETDSFSERSAAEKMKVFCTGKQATVVQAEKKRKQENRPLLYSLTSLQIDACDRCGFSAAHTLTVMQSLYEKKLLTYPRTESNYLTEDMVSEIPVLISLLESYDTDRVRHFTDIGLNIDKRIIDNSKVSDHHAIIPTKNILGRKNVQLSDDEKAVLDLVISRFFLAFEQPYVYDETSYVFDVSGANFRLRTTVPVTMGWKEYAKSEADDNVHIVYSEGDIFDVTTTEIKECETKPPKPYTESSLLGVMENIDRRLENKELRQYVKARGLGTTATRAAIIERLIYIQYIERRKKNLHATPKGVYLIEHLPEALKSVEMTANMESKLVAIEEGKAEPQEAIQQAVALIGEVMAVETSRAHDYKRPEPESIGKCPMCKGKVLEGKMSYYCSNYKADLPCTFSLWKNNDFFADKGKTLTAASVKRLLSDGKLLLSGCTSKSGKKYDAYIGLNEYIDKKGVRRMGFTLLEFKNKKKGAAK